jgi:hypothetical protein
MLGVGVEKDGNVTVLGPSVRGFTKNSLPKILKELNMNNRR